MEKDFEALLVEIEKKQKRRIQVPITWEAIGELIKDVQNPKPFEEDFIPSSPAPPVLLPEYPKLKVRYDYAKGGQAEEWLIVANGAEEANYHAGGWYTVFPPSQPASRPITTTLEAEVEKLKADGVPERPREEHERRRQTKGYTE